MPHCLEEKKSHELRVSIKEDHIEVTIPKIDFNGHYLSTLEQLLKLSYDNAPTLWVFDLSELDAMPIALASVLLGFAEEARKSGCEVMFSGMPNGGLPSTPRAKEWARRFGIEVALYDNGGELILHNC